MLIKCSQKLIQLMHRAIKILTCLTFGASANLLAGSTTLDSSGDPINDAGLFYDGHSTTTSASTTPWATFKLQKTTRVSSIIVVMAQTLSAPVAVKIWLGFDDADYVQCGSTITYDKTLSCGNQVTNVIKLEQPQNVSDLWAFIWDIYASDGLAASVTSAAEFGSQLNTHALTMDTQLWATSNKYFQSTHPSPDPDYWQVQYPSQIFIRSVVLFAARGSSLKDVQVRVKTSSEVDAPSQVCGSVGYATDFYLMECLKSGNLMRIEQTGSSALSLYYVAPIYQDSACASQTDCSVITNFSYSASTLPIIMASPPTMTLSSVFFNACLPVTWLLDQTNEVEGAAINRSTQDMLLAATAATYHTPTTAALKFKLVYFDGSVSATSGVLTRSTSISCVPAITYKIDSVEKVYVFTTDPGIITTRDYSTCLGGGSVTLACDQTDRPGYAAVSGQQIQLEFTKRGTLAAVDKNYFLKCTHSSGSQYFEDNYQVDSIDCVQGLTVPTPTMALDSQTIDVTSATPQKFIVQLGTNKSITVGEFSINADTSIYGKECGALSYSVTCSTLPAFVSQSSSNVFTLDTAQVTLGGTSATLSMKLKVSCEHFVNPIEYSFSVEVQECKPTANGQTNFNIYYLIDGVAATVTLPLVNVSSQNLPLSFVFYDNSGATQSKPSWLTYGSSLPPTLTIQLADSTLQGKYKVEVTVPILVPCTISFHLYLAALVAPSLTYEAQPSQGLTPLLASVVSSNQILFYKWSVNAPALTNASSVFPTTYSMSIDGANITADKNSSTTTKGMTWTANASGDYQLGWKILANKSDPDGLQDGTHSLVLTVGLTHILIDGDPSTRTASQLTSLTLKVIDCSDATHFSVPTVPSTVLYDNSKNALDASLSYKINVNNPYSFYLGAFGNNSCDFTGKCCPMTYSGKAYRSDSTLISDLNAGVEILQIDPSDLRIASNQIQTKRSPLGTENFIQPITFAVTVSNGVGQATVQTLRFILINCNQNPTLSQPNLAYFFDNTVTKTFSLAWQSPSTNLDSSCLAKVFVTGINGSIYSSSGFTSYLSAIYNYSPSFLTFDQDVRPPTVTIKPFQQNFTQFIRDWPMKMGTSNGPLENNPSQTSWSDEKTFYLGICTLAAITNNGVVVGQSTTLSTPGTRTILLQLSPTPSGATGSICPSLVISYSLVTAYSWLSLTTGATKNTVTLNLTGVAVNTYSFGYKFTYSTLNASGTQFEMHSVTKTITVTVVSCSASDWVFGSSWIALQTNTTPVSSASQFKGVGITLQAVFSNDKSNICGTTKYSQYIKVNDGTSEEIISPCTDFTACYGWQYHTNGQKYITINLSQRATTIFELTVTIVTTYYNDAISVAEGARKEWPNLKIRDCSLATLTIPDPWITVFSQSIGPSNTALQGATYQGNQRFTVQNFYYSESTCNEFTFSLVTTNTSLQSFIQRDGSSSKDFLLYVNAQAITKKVEIAVQLVVATPGMPNISFPFTYTLYDCTSTDEYTGRTYQYAAQLGEPSPLDLPVTLPYSTKNCYLEFCNTFIYDYMEYYGYDFDFSPPKNTGSYKFTLPSWLTITNYNPITAINGVNFNIKTSNVTDAGFYTLRKKLMAAGNQYVYHYINICIYEPPSPLFAASGNVTTNLQILDINETRCIRFNSWRQNRRNSACPGCAYTDCDPYQLLYGNYQFVRSGSVLTTSYSTGGTSGLAMGTYDSYNRNLCWKMPDPGLVSGNIYPMTYQLIGVLANSYSGQYTRTFSQDFTVEVISCSTLTIVDPNPWLKNTLTNTAITAAGATVYFPGSAYPQFQVQPYNSLCVNSWACCSLNFVSSTVKTFKAVDNSEVTGILSSSVNLISLSSEVNMQTLIGNAANVELNVELSMTTVHIPFSRSFGLKLVNCKINSQGNLSYLINRTTSMTFVLSQANPSCSSLIRVRNANKTVVNQPWLYYNESSQTQLIINYYNVQLADSVLSIYPVTRYVELQNGTVYNLLSFNFVFCKMTSPANNGVDLKSTTSFDNFNSTGSVKLATGSVTAYADCSTILYSVSGLDENWMDYNSVTNSIDLDLFNSTSTATFVYTLTYNDKKTPTYKVDYVITVSVYNCTIIMPANWVSPKLYPYAFATTFTQDSQSLVTYTVQQVTSCTNSACGTLTRTFTATISETGEDATSYLSQSSFDVTASLSARPPTHAILTMNLTVVIKNNNYSDTQLFTIEFFDCRIPTGTISTLPNQQIEVNELRSFTDQGFQIVESRCANFQILLMIEETAGQWITVTAAGTPSLVKSYTSTQSTSPKLSFSIQPDISLRGKILQCKLILQNRESAIIESAVFTVTICKAQVAQAFISPSSTSLNGNVFSFVRAITDQDPKLQVVVSWSYEDPTQSQCTYTSFAIEGLDTALMTSTTDQQQETLFIDSFAWISNGLVYSHELELKVWHDSEIVWFADAPHKFTVKIYDCEKDINAVTNWIMESYPHQGYDVYLFEEGIGDQTLHITTPSRNFPAQCGALVFEIAMTGALAKANLVVDPATGVITIHLPVNVIWGPEDVEITIKNSYSSIKSSVKLQAYDCGNPVISANESQQPAVMPFESTGTDWSYTWNAFTTTFDQCTLDVYEVKCTEGANNVGSGLCSRGFQINTSRTNTMAAALDGKMISPLTIYAQYQNATQISVDHEGEFNFTITAYNSLTPYNKASYSIVVKITTPCNEASNWVLPVKQSFVGSCRTANGKTFCDDVHYTVFQTQTNPIVAFTHRYPYSCGLSYQLKIKQAGVEQDAPSFLQILDSSGAVTTTNPAKLRIQTDLNSDVDFHKAELTLRATIITKTGQVVVGAVQAETHFTLFMYNDCTFKQVPVTNLGQTLAANFTVSQHLMSNPGYVNTINFFSVLPQKASDQKYCVILDSGLSLVQKNKPSTQLQPFNSNLFTFLPSQLASTGQISLHATNDDQVLSQTCTLSEKSTTSCKIEFEIQVMGMNGTYPVAATGSVEFKTECYLALEYLDLTEGAGTDRWVWAQSDQAKFKQPYRIRDDQVTLTLPRLTKLSLPSIDNKSGKAFVEVCGFAPYTIPSLQTNFTLVQPTLISEPPLLRVFSDDPKFADRENPPDFSRPYPLDLSATIPKTGIKIVFATTPARTDAMTFIIYDPCFGLEFTKPAIWYNDGRSSGGLSFDLRVIQPVLFDRYVVIFLNQEITKDHLKSCGMVVYGPGVIEGKSGVIKFGNLESNVQNQKGSQQFSIYADNNNQRGVYNVTFTAEIISYTGGYLYPQLKSTIQVTIEDCYVKVYKAVQQDPDTLNFNMFGKPQELQFAHFVQQPACNYAQSYNATVFKVESGDEPVFVEGSQPNPSPITFSRLSRTMTLETKNPGLVNSTYVYWITGHLSNPTKLQPQLTYNWGPFQAQILESKFLVENTAPTLPEMTPGYTVFAGEMQTVNLGKVFDLEGNVVSLKDWSVTSSASKWVKVSDNVKIDKLDLLSFDVYPPQDTADSTFSIFFTLADNHLRSPMTVDFVANVKVGEYVSQSQFEGWTTENKFATKQQQFLQEQPPTGNPQKISMSGGFVFEFARPLNLANLGNITQWNSTNTGQQYFRFELIPGDIEFFNDNSEAYLYNWNITNVTETSITFQFSFNQYNIISQRQSDSIRFKILKPEAFVSKVNGKQTDFTSSVQRLPKQVRSVQEQQQIQAVTLGVDRFLKTLSASSFINVLLSSSLQLLWGMVNALQVIVLTVLFKIDTPIIAQKIEIMVLKMVSFDIFHTDSVLQKVFNFDLEVNPPFNSKFEDASYDTSNFVLNMGIMFLMEILYIVLAGLVPLFKWLMIGQSARIERYLNKIKLFNNFARFYFESQLEICICTLMTIRMMNKNVWSQPVLWFANLCAFGNLCMLVIMPIILGYVSHQFHKKYNTDWDYRAKYADIFDELRGNRKSSMLYFTFFTLRRYAIACSLIAMPNHFLFQIFLQVFSSSLFLVYLLDDKQHKCVRQGKIEIFNELTISLSGYFLFLFTDLVSNVDRKTQAGWALVALIVTNLVVNVGIITVDSILDYKQKIRRFWYDYKIRKLRNRMLQVQEAENRRLAEQSPPPQQSELVLQFQEPNSSYPLRRLSLDEYQESQQEEEKIQPIRRRQQAQSSQHNNTPHQPDHESREYQAQRHPQQNEELRSRRQDPPHLRSNVTEEQTRQRMEQPYRQDTQLVGQQLSEQNGPQLAQKNRQMRQRFQRIQAIPRFMYHQYASQSHQRQPMQVNRRSSQEQDLEDFINGTNKRPIEQILYNRHEESKGSRLQDRGRSTKPLFQHNSQSTTQQNSEANSVATSPKAYSHQNDKTQKRDSQRSPYQVIQDYNDQNDAISRLYRRHAASMVSHRPAQPTVETEKRSLPGDNVWPNQREKFVRKKPVVTEEEKLEFKAAQEYLDRKFGGMN